MLISEQIRFFRPKLPVVWDIRYIQRLRVSYWLVPMVNWIRMLLWVTLTVNITILRIIGQMKLSRIIFVRNIIWVHPVVVIKELIISLSDTWMTRESFPVQVSNVLMVVLKEIISCIAGWKLELMLVMSIQRVATREIRMQMLPLLQETPSI